MNNLAWSLLLLGVAGLIVAWKLYTEAGYCSWFVGRMHFDLRYPWESLAPISRKKRIYSYAGTVSLVVGTVLAVTGAYFLIV